MTDAISLQTAGLRLAMFSYNLCQHLSDSTIECKFESECDILAPQPKKIADANISLHDANRSRMYVNTPTETNGT